MGHQGPWVKPPAPPPPGPDSLRRSLRGQQLIDLRQAHLWTGLAPGRFWKALEAGMGRAQNPNLQTEGKHGEDRVMDTALGS